MSFGRHTSLLVAATLMAGCGLAAGPSAQPRDLGEFEASSTLDETDLTAGARRRQISPAALRREGLFTRDGVTVFPTKVRAAASGIALPSGGDQPVVAGELQYPGFRGEPIAAANVTVHLETRGTFGGAKEVATALTDANGNWQATLPADMLGKPLSASYELGNRRWTINKYRWAGPSIPAVEKVNDTGVRQLDPNSQNGKAALIHEVWNRALATFRKADIPIDPWWTRPIGTNWPASGNYYSFGTVNLTDAEWWDVNGHEIGHAIFFAGFNSASGGGPHKIDECYGADLAWSEGFASFFAAVISIERADPDAKFQFMVPRRAPIRVENVPDDVCKGHTNEWRVGSALWDIYDTHDDGTDAVAIEFASIWGALVKTQNAGHMADVRDAFKRVATSQPAELRPRLEGAFAQSGVPVAFRVAF